MQAHSKEEMIRYRDWHEKSGHKKFTVQYKDLNFPCYVLPVAKCPAGFPHAVQRVTPPIEIFRNSTDPDWDPFFAVSEHVPPKFRKFFVIHEIAEFLFIGCDQPNRCQRAASDELDALFADMDISPEQEQQYIRLRRDMFKEELIPYALKNKFDAADIGEMEKALEHYEFMLEK